MLECLCMCTHESERSELLNVSVLAWLYSCIYATSICISAYVGGGGGGGETQSDQKYLSMHANAVYLIVFITFCWIDICDKCFRYLQHLSVLFKIGHITVPQPNSL